jgi:hypothetical protein
VGLACSLDRKTWNPESMFVGAPLENRRGRLEDNINTDFRERSAVYHPGISS